MKIVDVLIIGGGLAGCALAWRLAQRGLEALLVERGELGDGASSANSGSLHCQMPMEPFALNGEAWGRNFAPTLRLMGESVRLWRGLPAELGVDLEVANPGGLIVAASAAEMATVAAKVAIEREQGVAVELLDRASLHALAPYVDARLVGGAFCPGEGKANPLLATPAFARAARDAGVELRTGTEVLAISREGDGFDVSTSRGPIRARRIVNCAGAEAGRIATMVGLQLPIEAHAIQSSITERTAPLVTHLVYSAFEKLSLKQTRAGTILIGGGWPARPDREGGRPAVDLGSLSQNLEIARRVVPAIGRLRLVRSWAAIVNGTADWKPILGEAPRVPGFWMSFFPWMGFTAGPLVAQLVADMLAGRDPGMDLRPFLIADR